jgi:hypothetical protein
VTLEEFAEKLRALVSEANDKCMVAVAKESPDGDVWLMVGCQHPDGPEDAYLFVADITP